MTMIATYHAICSFPGCGHTALMKQPFDWPIAVPPEPEFPEGWSVVLRRRGEAVSIIAICAEHDFSFDGVKAADLRPVGFQIEKGGDSAA